MFQAVIKNAGQQVGGIVSYLGRYGITTKSTDKEKKDCLFSALEIRDALLVQYLLEVFPLQECNGKDQTGDKLLALAVKEYLSESINLSCATLSNLPEVKKASQEAIDTLESIIKMLLNACCNYKIAIDALALEETPINNSAISKLKLLIKNQIESKAVQVFIEKKAARVTIANQQITFFNNYDREIQRTAQQERMLISPPKL